MTTPHRIVANILLLWAPVASAQLAEAQLDSIETAFSLNEVVVTGTLTPKLLKDTPVATRLISRADLRRADATNLQDLLQAELPGVEFAYAMNQQVNLNLAGFSGLGVLVLVDGERLAGETMDNVDFSRLPMGNVERIEITRGAASALYGSNAVGGVVNIITRRPRRKWEAAAGVRTGSHGLWRADISAAFKAGIVSNSLSADFNRTGGFDVCLDYSDECDFRRVYPQRVWNIADRLTITPSNNITLTGRAGYYFKQWDYNPDTPDRYRAFSGGASARWQFDGGADASLAYAFDQYDKSDFVRLYGLDLRDYSNVQHSLKALCNIGSDEPWTLTIGADMLRDWLMSYQFENRGVHCRYSADAFAQFDWAPLRVLELVAALRADWAGGDGWHLSPKLSLRCHCGPVTLRGAYATGFRTPSLKEKYMQFDMAGIFDIHGNPSLKAEKSHSFNIGAELPWRNFHFMAGASYSIVLDKIATSALMHDADGDPFIHYLNVANLKVAGLEAAVRGAWRCGISASLAYNFTHEQTRGSGIDQYCPARPHSVTGHVSWNHGWRRGCDTGISLSGRFLSAVSYNSMYMYEPFETRRVTNPAYSLWKVQLSQSLAGGVRLIAEIDNLLNYKPKIYSYNSPVTTGTTFSVGLDIEFDRFNFISQQ